MAIRISSSTKGTTRIVRVEGRLEAAFVPDLLTESRPGESAMRLDLSGLQSADKEGLRAIRFLRADGAELDGASPYIRELLDGGS
jgi:hypothetical protein